MWISKYEYQRDKELSQRSLHHCYSSPNEPLKKPVTLEPDVNKPSQKLNLQVKLLIGQQTQGVIKSIIQSRGRIFPSSLVSMRFWFVSRFWGESEAEGVSRMSPSLPRPGWCPRLTITPGSRWSHIGPASLPSINWSLSPLQFSSQLRSMLIILWARRTRDRAHTSPLLDTLIKVF